MIVLCLFFAVFLFLFCLYQDFGHRYNLKPKFILKYTEIYRSGGLKGVIKKGGWKILFYFFMFYLIRDSILYLLIPYLIGKGFINNFAN